MAHGTAQVIPLEKRETRRTPLGKVLRVAMNPVSAVWPRPTVDEWGRDARLINVLAPFTHARWDVSVGGEHHLPRGAALVVVNTRRFALTPVSTALALGEALGRPVRFAGRPDIAPFGPLLRRVGGLLADPDEIAGALRAGEIVVVGAEARSNPRHAGAIDPAMIAAAVREHAPVHVAAALSSMISRQARVEVATALHPRRKRRGPLAELELAEQAQRGLQGLLDELGATRTAIPGLGWLGES